MTKMPAYEQLQEENALLHAHVADLIRQLAALKAEKEKLCETIAGLQERVEESDRAGHRQAGPSSVLAARARPRGRACGGARLQKSYGGQAAVE